VSRRSARKDQAITLSVGTELRQSYRTADMTWDVAYLVDYVHFRNSLAAGDLLFTGTSTGVGMLVMASMPGCNPRPSRGPRNLCGDG
jgi:2-keto-4-pentenoate hydratase/2-oxohepta-3-ene-1,7-dioic acid hydratase in catechol pathway